MVTHNPARTSIRSRQAQKSYKPSHGGQLTGPTFPSKCAYLSHLVSKGARVPRNRAFPDHVSSPHATHLICLVSFSSRSHYLRSFRLSSPASSTDLRLSTNEPSRITRVVGRLAICSALPRQPHSARVAHSLPLTGAFWDLILERRTYAVFRWTFVRFPCLPSPWTFALHSHIIIILVAFALDVVLLTTIHSFSFAYGPSRRRAADSAIPGLVSFPPSP